MKRVLLIAVPAALLAINGSLHGLWSHRWQTWSEPGVRAAADRLDAVPLQIGEWDGQRMPADPLTLPEEEVGRGVSMRYVSRADGAVVHTYFACGPTDAAIGHTPPVCYPANGYACRPPDLRTTLTLEPDTPEARFWVSGFSRAEGAAETHLRVFWAWSDGRGWQTPGNPGRTYRHTPTLYKCYFVRQLATPDEPLAGDPCLRLMTALLPRVDDVLAGKN